MADSMTLRDCTPSVPIATFASSRGTLSCELRDRTDRPPTGLGRRRYPPRRESGADQRLRAREIVDQLEALAAGGRVGDHPVPDFLPSLAPPPHRNRSLPTI